MAAVVVPYPGRFTDAYGYVEPYGTEFLALVATDGPANTDRTWGMVIDIKTRRILSGGQEPVLQSARASERYGVLS